MQILLIALGSTLIAAGLLTRDTEKEETKPAVKTESVESDETETEKD